MKGPRFEAYQTVFIDVDSCVSGIEGIDELARMRGKGDKVAELTREAMEGKVPLDAVFGQRLALINPHKENLRQVADLYKETLVPDARGTIQLLQGENKQIFLLSGGYQQAIEPVAEALGIPTDNVFANVLIFDQDGAYQGFDKTIPLWQKGGKRTMIEQLKRLGRVRGKVVIIGDGISEVEAKETVDLCVGFGGFVTRQKVQEEADCFIRHKTLAPLIPIMLGPDATYQAIEQFDTSLLVEWGMAGLYDARFHDRAACMEDEVRNFVRDRLGPYRQRTYEFWALPHETWPDS